MSSTWDATGVVHLRDLVDRYRWDTRKLPAYLDRLGLGDVSQKAPPDQFTTSSFSTPKRLIVLNRDEDTDLWKRFRSWLSQAAELHLVVCHYHQPDLERRHQLEREAFSALAELPIVQLVHWVKGEEAPASLGLVLENSKLGWPNPPTLPALETSGPGPWLEWPDPPGWQPELDWPRWVCHRDGAPAMYHPSSGRFLNLRSGEWSEPVGPPTKQTRLCVAPDGQRLLSSNFRGEYSLLDLTSGRLHTFQGPAGSPIGIWPGQEIGWSGHRCTFNWLHLQQRAGGSLSACDHDWPCGHEKKQYGFLDNEPCWVHLSPICDAYLSVYQKDAVISAALPVGWRSFGAVWAATSDPAMDPTRALFFTHDGSNETGDPQEVEDGDARDLRPVIVLGPDPAHRYALDLSRSVYRIVGESVSEVNEPVDGYAVFDSNHDGVRYETGRLLGGWGRSLLVCSGSELWREDLVSGQRASLGRESKEISWAFPIPASANLILVSGGQERAQIRLV